MRSLPMCAAWLVFTVASLVFAFQQTQPLTTIILWLSALYGAQGLIAESLGLRMNGASITFPRRLASGFPLLVFWRAQIRCAEIDRIRSKWQNQIRVNKTNGERTKVIFANRAMRSSFFQFIKKTNPSVEIC
ncbi:MAG: hypothetical protein WB816_10965 [Methylocystis sp.]